MKICVLTVILFILLNLTNALSLKDHEQSLAQFCWRNSIGRGVGTIPSVCASNRDKIGLLCYSKCPSGYSRFGFDCHQNCPSTGGWADQGLFCRLSEYGRGGGYPWKFGDALNDNGMRSRCEAANGRGNCEKNGLIYYPKCKSGFYAIGCCICRPSAPNCGALGFNGGIDLSCAKKITIGDPISMECPAGQIYDAGLCYSGCQAGYTGVGPVCWASAPAGWVNCGMGAAKDSKTCGETIFGQINSVGNLALNIATFGAGKAATIAKDTAKVAELKKQFETLKKLSENNSKVQDLINKGQGKYPVLEAGKSVGGILKADPSTVSPEDIVRVSA
jgi:hypothetical protein